MKVVLFKAGIASNRRYPGHFFTSWALKFQLLLFSFQFHYNSNKELNIIQMSSLLFVTCVLDNQISIIFEVLFDEPNIDVVIHYS